MNAESNPLSKYFRKPSIYVQIPTGGRFNPEIDKTILDKYLGVSFFEIDDYLKIKFLSLKYIFINNELEVLRVGLEAAASILLPGARLLTISFHSMEDRIVKRFRFRYNK